MWTSAALLPLYYIAQLLLRFGVLCKFGVVLAWNRWKLGEGHEAAEAATGWLA